MKRFMTIRRGLALAALMCIAASGCIVGVVDLDDVNGSGDEEASRLVVQTVPVANRDGIRVTGLNGNITVSGVAGVQEVTIRATKRVRSWSVADAEAHLSDILVRVRTAPEEVLVETVHSGEAGGRSYSVDYEIIVPEAFFASVALANGNTILEELDSRVDVDLANGNVIIRRVVGSAQVSLGNGNLIASMTMPAEGEILFSVGNGSATLTIQREVSAQLNAHVGFGNITVSGLPLQDPVSGPNSFRCWLGSGTGAIDISVGNGNIQVQGG
jgi:hypothetical protein